MVAAIDGTDVFAPYKYLEEPDGWYICGVAVTPEHRGCGIGKQLMTIARKQAIKHGYDRMGLVVFAENTTAIRLYQYLRYNVIKRAPVVAYRLIPAVVMHYSSLLQLVRPKEL